MLKNFNLMRVCHRLINIYNLEWEALELVKNIAEFLDRHTFYFEMYQTDVYPTILSYLIQLAREKPQHLRMYHFQYIKFIYQNKEGVAEVAEKDEIPFI